MALGNRNSICRVCNWFSILISFEGSNKFIINGKRDPGIASHSLEKYFLELAHKNAHSEVPIEGKAMGDLLSLELEH